MSGTREASGGAASAPVADGPWRVADACVLVIAAGRTPDPGRDGRGDAFVADLRQAGLPLSTVLVPASEADLGRAMEEIVAAGADMLWLDAGVDLDPASAAELRRVAASDPMIAGVSPRRDREGACAPWRRLLPPVRYAPLADPLCLYLKGSVLRAFGTMPLGDAPGWDAYAMAVNTMGFRMALANHAAYRAKPEIEAVSLASRARRLEGAFPGATGAVAAFLSGTPEAAERVLQGLGSDTAGRRTVAFDLTHIGTRRSGTAEVALALIRRAATAWTRDWGVAVIASAAVHAAHFAGAPGAPRRIDPSDPEVCAAFIRIGQPFGWKEVDAAVRRAPALVFFMLDTIGLDCVRLAPDDLDAVWRFTLAEADGLLFNSAFTRRQYERRFATRPDQPRLASLHSLDSRDYDPGEPSGPADGPWLVIGNAFPHKRVEETARLLAKACPGRSITALGPGPGAIEGVACHPSGALDPKSLAALYGRASLVVYPSVYEGFGFPVLEALAHRKPVLVRALPPFAEIAAGTPEAANIHLFETDEDLLALAAAAPRWTDARGAEAARDWNDALADMRWVLDEAVAAVDYERVLRRIDVLRGRLAFIRHKSFHDEAFGDDIDRLSALAGRGAAQAVRRLASLPGVAPLLRRLLAAARRSGP